MRNEAESSQVSIWRRLRVSMKHPTRNIVQLILRFPRLIPLSERSLDTVLYIWAPGIDFISGLSIILLIGRLRVWCYTEVPIFGRASLWPLVWCYISSKYCTANQYYQCKPKLSHDQGAGASWGTYLCIKPESAGQHHPVFKNGGQICVTEDAEFEYLQSSRISMITPDSDIGERSAVTSTF